MCISLTSEKFCSDQHNQDLHSLNQVLYCQIFVGVHVVGFSILFIITSLYLKILFYPLSLFYIYIYIYIYIPLFLSLCLCVHIYIYIHTHNHLCLSVSLSIYIYHHHHVVLVARVSLTLSRHFSLSLIASVRSSGLHPVFSHSCWMYVQSIYIYIGREEKIPINNTTRFFFVCVYIYIYIYIHTHLLLHLFPSLSPFFFFFFSIINIPYSISIYSILFFKFISISVLSNSEFT